MRRMIAWAVVGVLGLGLGAWIANNTYWADVTVPLPPKGEALHNPFYAAQRFAEALGARTSWDRTLDVPAADEVIVLSDWHWSLSASRREAIKRWVESGGRLVVDDSLVDDEDFEAWSGIVRNYKDETSSDERTTGERVTPCRKFEPHGEEGASAASDTYWLCDVDQDSFLSTRMTALWTLSDRTGTQAVRVHVGRGRVTAINAVPFVSRRLFDGDHGRLFVTATELGRGDMIHFLSESDHPSLLALIWQYGAPVVVCAVAMLVLGLWRGSIRFGPLAPVPDGARRSLAEQIRGTGHFAARHEGGDSLQAACVRALDEAAERRLSGYRRRAGRDRADALARLTGFDRDALNAAIHHPRLRRDHELASTIALLEAARRRALEREPPASGGESRDSHQSTSLLHGTS